MDNYKYLKNILYHIIDDMNNSCSLFCENPDTDFIRSCKLDFKTTSILCMETSSLKDKFYQLFDYSSTTPLLPLLYNPKVRLKWKLFSYS